MKPKKSVLAYILVFLYTFSFYFPVNFSSNLYFTFLLNQSYLFFHFLLLTNIATTIVGDTKPNAIVCGIAKMSTLVCSNINTNIVLSLGLLSAPPYALPKILVVQDVVVILLSLGTIIFAVHCGAEAYHGPGLAIMS